MVLVSGISEDKLRKSNKDGKMGVLHFIFNYVVKWNSILTLENKLAWLCFSRVPLHVWTKDCFSMLVLPFGRVVAIDKGTSERVRLDAARVIVKAIALQHVNIFEEISINGRNYLVSMVEEIHVQQEKCKCWRWERHGKSTNDGFVGSVVGVDVSSSYANNDDDEGLFEEK